VCIQPSTTAFPARAAMASLGAAVADMIVPVEERRDRREFGHAVSLGQAHVWQGRCRAIQQCFADGRCAIGDIAQGRDIVGRQRRMIDQHLDHGRNQQYVGDAFVLDGGHHALRRKALDDDVGAAAKQQRIHRRAIGEMEHRRRVKID